MEGNEVYVPPAPGKPGGAKPTTSPAVEAFFERLLGTVNAAPLRIQCDAVGRNMLRIRASRLARLNGYRVATQRIAPGLYAFWLERPAPVEDF